MQLGVNSAVPDLALFYFGDIEIARAFVERFACGLLLPARLDPAEHAVMSSTSEMRCDWNARAVATTGSSRRLSLRRQKNWLGHRRIQTLLSPRSSPCRRSALL